MCQEFCPWREGVYLGIPLGRHPLGRHPQADTPHPGQTPPRQTPPRQTPPRQTPPLGQIGRHPQADTHPKHYGIQSTRRAVRILLECILVCIQEYTQGILLDATRIHSSRIRTALRVDTWNQLKLTLLPSATKLRRLFFYTCLSFCPQGWGCYPRIHCRWYPSMPCSRGVHAQGGGCSQGCLLWWGGGSAPRGRCETPPRKQTATVADGTHPTGMHSCFILVVVESTSRLQC